MNQDNENLLNNFASSVVDVLVPNNILSVTMPKQTDERDFPDFFSSVKNAQEKVFLDLKFDEGIFDLILGTIPLHLRANHLGTTKFDTKEASFEIILRLCENLSQNGFGIFPLGPLGFYGLRNEKFIKLMESKNIFINGYINLPEKILQPVTNLRPILVVISKNKSELILDSLDEGIDIKKLCLKFFGDTAKAFKREETSQTKISESKTLKTVLNEAKLGIELSRSYEEFGTKDDIKKEFRGFQSIDIQKQIDRLETRYNDFKKIKFKDTIQEYVMGRTGKTFAKLDNCIYFRTLGTNNSLITDQKELTGRIDNYIQVQLKSDFLNQYLKIFFKSHLGELIFKYVFNSSLLPRLDRKILWMTEIPFPNLAIQSQVIETNNRFEKLELEINQLKNQISLNPQSVSVLTKIDSMLEISNSLTESDVIKSLVLQGESKTLEFKQTFQYCLKTQKKQPYIEISCLKTLVGFLNSDGGTLLVGVEDSGLFPGVNFEIKEFHRNSTDRFLLHLKDKIKSRLGSHCLSNLETKIIDIDNQLVLEIVCEPSKDEVFLDNKDFYVRTSPSTEKLEGRDLSSYVLNRFK